jgi:hypothetical protein
MYVEPSSVPGVELIGPGTGPETGNATGDFMDAVTSLLGREPDEILKPALPYSVVVRNGDPRAVAFLGIRFDMTALDRKSYSVVHYADALRNPERADLKSGGMRFVCAEPLYTDLVLRGAGSVDPRGPMNLENLRRVSRIRASVDCAAFEDGAFAGFDTLGAFERLGLETIAEARFIEELLRPGCSLHALLDAALEIPAERTRDRALLARRTLAKRIAEGLYLGGIEEALARARSHRHRIPLHRGERVKDGEDNGSGADLSESR